MENNLNLIKILTLVIILLAAFAAILYVYPYNAVNLSHSSQPNSTSNITNSVKLTNFLSRYDINLSGLSDKDLYYFYGGLPNNSIVFGCDYEILPLFPAVPLNETVTSSEYNSIIKDITLISMCSVENQTNCTSADDQLFNFIKGSMNYTEVSELFNLTYTEIESYYSEIVSSGLQNYSIVNPIKYDLKLFNASKNESSMIDSILKMKQMPVNIVFNGLGNMLDYANETPVYSPFQFQVFRLINATSCSYSTLFNVVVDPAYFSSSTYRDIYKGVGNATNICIVDGNNNCNTSELKELNASFYAN